MRYVLGGHRCVWPAWVPLLVVGCAGPMPLDRAIRGDDATVYAAEVERFRGTSKEAFLRWRAREQDLSYEELSERDTLLDRKNPFANDDAHAISLGALIYLNQCLRCHGPNADGNGASALPDYPPKNFRSLGSRTGVLFSGGAPSGWFEDVRDGHGGDIEYGDGVTREMPAFGDKLANEQIWLVLTYLAAND